MSWELNRVGDICKVKSGKRLPKGISVQDEPTTRKYLRVTDLKSHVVDESDIKYISEDVFKLISRYTISCDDIYISIAGTIGKVGIIPASIDGISLTENCCKLTELNKSKIIQHFLLYYLRSYEGQSKMQANTGGASQPKLAITRLKDILIPTPPIQTQKRIADILSSYDDLIENNLKRIKLLEQAAQNIYKEWFVNMRFPGHENTLIDQETGLPEGWKECLLNEYIDFKEGPGLRNWQYRTEGIPFLNIRMMKSGDLNFSSVKFLEINEVEKKYNHFLLKEYDHIISTSGTLGKVVTIRKSHLPLCLNTSIIRLRPIRDEVGKWYIKRKVSCSNFLNEMKSFATGSAQLNFGPKHLNMMKIIVPSKFIGLEFEKLTNPIELKILSLLDYNQKLKKARDILLPRLMNQTIEV